jgi:hypothetical protein
MRMNDVGRRDPAWFASQTRDRSSLHPKADPEIEIILVAPMLGNSVDSYPRDMFGKYRRTAKADRPRRRVGRPDRRLGIARHKSTSTSPATASITPNFGHRLYAQAILELLCKSIAGNFAAGSWFLTGAAFNCGNRLACLVMDPLRDSPRIRFAGGSSALPQRGGHRDSPVPIPRNRFGRPCRCLNDPFPEFE